MRPVQPLRRTRGRSHPSGVGGLLAIALAGCGTEASSDADHYRAALVADPTQAAALCRQIEDPSLAGECGTFAARRMTMAGALEPALAACEAIEDGLWSDECVFVAVDTAGLEGAAARDACDRAGRYREFCLGHAVNRTVANLDPASLPLAVGDEDALGEVISAQIERDGPTLPRPHRETVWFTGMARWLAQRWTEAPFDDRACGVASEDLCRRAYTETMQARMEQVDRDRICAGDLTSEAVQAAGGTPWVEGSETIVVPAWAALCMGVGVSRSRDDIRRGAGPRAPQDRPRRGKSKN